MQTPNELFSENAFLSHTNIASLGHTWVHPPAAGVKNRSFVFWFCPFKPSAVLCLGAQQVRVTNLNEFNCTVLLPLVVDVNICSTEMDIGTEPA